LGQNSYIDWDLNEQLSTALDGDWIPEGTPAFDVTRQVIDQGLGSLTERQRYAPKWFAFPFACAILHCLNSQIVIEEIS
jgi:hypothetical protein